MSSGIAPTDTLVPLRVEEEIIHTEENIRQQTVTFLSNLCATKNSFLPVFRLPPETLEIIFIGARKPWKLLMGVYLLSVHLNSFAVRSLNFRLKILSICNVRFAFPSMVDSLEVLRSMEEVTTLRLVGFLPSAQGFLSSGGLGISPKISLPHLALLSVSGPLSAVIASLSCVNMPSKPQLILDLLFERGSSASDYAPISSFLAHRFSTPEHLATGPAFRSLIIDTILTTSVTFSYAERDCCLPSVSEELGHDIPLQVSLMDEMDETDSTESIDDMTHLAAKDECHIVRVIVYSLPLTNVQSLHLIRPCRGGPWREILGHMDGLWYIKLSNALIPDNLVRSLVTRDSKKNPGGRLIRAQGPALGHTLAPALEGLELCQITFAPDDESQWPGYMSQRSLHNALYSQDPSDFD